MNNVQVGLCPKTGICSLIAGYKSKIDLVRNKVEDLCIASDDPVKI